MLQQLQPASHCSLAPGSVATPVVCVVDGDVETRTSLGALFRGEGWRSQGFDSASAFLASPTPASPHCVILDIGISDFDSRELQMKMAERCSRVPVILTAEASSIPPALRVIKTGAPDFLIKPFEQGQLLAAVGAAIARSVEIRSRELELRELQQRYGSLSRRERQVMDLVAAGLLNKQVGGELGISEITVKAHRGRAMEKMRAPSFAGLVAMSLSLRTAGLPAFTAHPDAS